MSAVDKERFFYHSFPRRGSNTDAEIDKGCKILSLICNAGLLLAPEVVTWQYPHADGSPPRTQFSPFSDASALPSSRLPT